MDKCLRKISLFLFLVYNPFSVFAQNDLALDDYSFVCETRLIDMEKSLNSGARAFQFELGAIEKGYLIRNSKQEQSLAGVLEHIKEFLQHKNDPLIALIFSGNFQEKLLYEYVKTFFSDALRIDNTTAWPKIESLQKMGIQVLVIFEQNLVSTSIAQVREAKKHADRFSSDPFDKLIFFESSKAIQKNVLLSQCLEMWNRTGVPPNFISAPLLEPSIIKWVSDSLNTLRRFRGIVHYNGELLNEIRWAKKPGTVTSAKFSFPLRIKEQILYPYKNGYRISPAEIIHHSRMSDAPRELTAYTIPMGDKLIYDFDFEQKKAINVLEPDWSGIIVKDISTVKDTERGKVLHVSKFNSFLDYSKNNTLNFESPISISVWIKPDSIPDYMGILGFGSSFSMKLKNGILDFTTTTIKDHIIGTPLEVSQWYHVLVVYNPKAALIIYLNGEKIGESIASEMILSKHSLVIGNNIWGEQYYGSIDDLKVWNRGLSAKEAMLLFTKTKGKNAVTNYWFLGLTALLLVSLIVFFSRKGLGRRLKPRTLGAKTSFDSLEKNSLQLFGNFQLTLHEKAKDCPSFSPLLKQILSFLILRTAENKNGVTTTTLTETFWPGMSKEKGKENRGTNIRKLRKLLEKIKGVQIIYADTKWYVTHDSSMVIDVFRYVELKTLIEDGLADKTIDSELLNSFLNVLEQGNILQNIHAEWIDYYKNKISTDVDNILSKVYRDHRDILGTDANIKLAKTILHFDGLNEGALKIAINELIICGKHGQAQDIYKTYVKNYEVLYAEPFGITYKSLADNSA
ncbi:MAG: hypothetical protein QM485_09315 [Flavobacteriaceae bacterium]